ncbi:matrixin family metalloprotease [Halobacteriovorax sp. XZX-3]|uniref:matrixin family metalloprotease n=1 Tax=unclassified Halobacteriovorax TaxID=2639665 RepID=UPI003711ABC4
MKFIISLLLSTYTLAFTINANIPIRFASPEIRVDIADNACANITDSADEIMDMVEIAVSDYWNKIATSSLHLKGGDILTVNNDYTTEQICAAGEAGCVSQVPSTNTQILIVCNSNNTVFTSTGILAVTLPNNLNGTVIQGSVIGLNDIAGTRYNDQTRAQKIALFAHEIGHAFGLGHSSKESSLMYFRNLTGRETIGQDDWDGATYLYPKEQIPMCGSIAPIKDSAKYDGHIYEDIEKKISTEFSEHPPAKDSAALIAGLCMLLLVLVSTKRFAQAKIY